MGRRRLWIGRHGVHCLLLLCLFILLERPAVSPAETPAPTVQETIGLNFVTLSWSERIGKWGTNLTVGAGPTSDQHTRFLQNDFVHRDILRQAAVPVGETREGPTPW